jgi:hypothetical protein
MPQGQSKRPEFELPAILRLPQIPPSKVPARRQTQFIVPPSPARYTEQIPVTPPIAPEKDLFMPVPITPPITSQAQRWVRVPYPANQSITGIPIKGFIPTGKRSRDMGTGEVLLGCAFLIVVGLLALGLLIWLSAAR